MQKVLRKMEEVNPVSGAIYGGDGRNSKTHKFMWSPVPWIFNKVNKFLYNTYLFSAQRAWKGVGKK